MQKMVGFRNIAMHDYQAINLAIAQSVIENRLYDIKTFTKAALSLE
ncbi:MAG: DUF86 domain-containing protein [Coxiellaceae bacterium]|nr:DUF86 domain-containing protein [Coxiellaceae bacterium]